MKKPVLMITAMFGSIALANANVIYVAKDGTGGGASWNDPASIQSAFAAAAEGQDMEIWLKEGFYNLTSALALCSDLTVRGGFAGTESSAALADPEAHPTVLSAIPENSLSLYQWSSNTVRVSDSPVWPDGVFNLCRPDDEATLCRYPTIGNGSVGFANIMTTPNASIGVKIYGITFTGSRKSALVVSAGSNVEIEKCRFLACGVGTTALAGPGAISAAGCISASGCGFFGCSSAVALTGSDAAKTNTFAHCIFDGCTGAWSSFYAAAIYATGEQALKVIGCTFANNVGVSRGNGIGGVYATGTAISYSARNGALFVADTRFEGNRARSLDTNTPAACLFSWSPVVIERCLFKDNSLKGDALDCAQSRSVCLYVYSKDAPLTVRDTVFTGNTIVGRTSLAAGQRWGCAAIVEKDSAKFVNCAFYGNDSFLQATTAGTASHANGVVNVIRSSNGEDNRIGVTFVNCLFVDNQQSSNLDRQADVYLDGESHAGFTLSFINTVVWSWADNHRAYYADAAYPVSVSHSVLVNCQAAAMTNGNDYVEYLTAVNPSVSEKILKKKGLYSFDGMRGLTSSSPYAKKGTPVYEKDGDFFFYAPGQVDGKPWRTCHLKGDSLVALDGATLVADGFGEARAAERFSYGPVIDRKMGLTISVN